MSKIKKLGVWHLGDTASTECVMQDLAGERLDPLEDARITEYLLTDVKVLCISSHDLRFNEGSQSFLLLYGKLDLGFSGAFH